MIIYQEFMLLRHQLLHLGTTSSSSKHPTLAYESSNPLTAFKDEAGQNDTLMCVSKKSPTFEAAIAPMNSLKSDELG
ncbi:hypothetical protein KY289_031477 [Solanum tuberosum]|nr:hypothetical protein KY289_031477 [Solanum tuberosum]